MLGQVIIPQPTIIADINAQPDIIAAPQQIQSALAMDHVPRVIIVRPVQLQRQIQYAQQAVIVRPVQAALLLVQRGGMDQQLV